MAFIMNMYLTPVENIDWDSLEIINNDNIFNHIIEGEDKIKVYDTEEQKEKIIKAINISLNMHKVILNNQKYQILHMLSKSI